MFWNSSDTLKCCLLSTQKYFQHETTQPNIKEYSKPDAKYSLKKQHLKKHPLAKKSRGQSLQCLKLLLEQPPNQKQMTNQVLKQKHIYQQDLFTMTSLNSNLNTQSNPNSLKFLSFPQEGQKQPHYKPLTKISSIFGHKRFITVISKDDNEENKIDGVTNLIEQSIIIDRHNPINTLQNLIHQY